jgi:flagellar hook-basal body complex protein FliE
MSDVNVNLALAQMRAMSAGASNQPKPAASAGDDFAALLKDSIDSVNQTQKTAQKMTENFEKGTSDASLAEVMVSVQKAGVSFQAMVEVRNKLSDAYKEVMNMPL